MMARDLPVRHLGALLAHAGLCIANDTGVAHLAAAAGVPTLALFGPTDPTTWAPVGPRVETVRSADGTMAGLETGRVDAAVERLRGGSG
jgi:ADP-heptose:LPS heptosyltransferase